jgi:dienelactone hydrolase
MRAYLSGLVLSFTALLAACGGGGGSESSGLMYQTTVYSAAEISVSTNIAYSTRPNLGGRQYTSDARKNAEEGTGSLTLLMDIWVPPNNGSARPLVVWVHGGGFRTGGKEARAEEALGYARAGYAAASVNYRLTPDNETNAATRTLAIQQATDDVMNAIRYLKANAALYRIDPTRIAIMGTSAGGAIALVEAVEYDTLDNTSSDYPGQSAKVASVVSTGATLVDPLFDSDTYLSYNASDSPVLLFHTRPTDGTTGATWTGNVLPTKAKIDGSGNTCTAVATPEVSHTVSLAMDTAYWNSDIRAFLWSTLRLASL